MEQAVILAAGCGRRMAGTLNGDPKCLAQIGGKTLLEHQLGVLAEFGIERVCVVVGYAKEKVISTIGNDYQIVVNERYAETNSLYSLYLALERVSGPFVLLNGDVLAHPDIYRRVLSIRGSGLAFDSSSGKAEEHMKVSLDGQLVRSVDKKLPLDEVNGENVGILKFEESATKMLFDEAGRAVECEAVTGVP